MKQLIFTLFIGLTAHLAVAQIDMKKMDRDLAVAENVLQTVLKENENFNSEDLHFGLRGKNVDVESKYLEDFGVMFTVEAGGVFYCDNKKKGKEVEIITKRPEDDLMIDQAKVFLADYGTLIKQLDGDHRIMVSIQPKHHNWLENQKSHVQVAAHVSDIEALANESISRDEFMSRVDVDEEETTKIEPQIQVFATMLEGLYDSDFTKTYYMSKRPSSKRMKNFGATYSLKLYSSLVHDDDDYSVPAAGKKHISKQERDRIVDEMYPKFVEQFKEDVLEYGLILKPLESHERIIFDIILTSCDPCDMPTAIELSVKKEVIEAYHKGSLSLEEAKNTFTLHELD